MSFLNCLTHTVSNKLEIRLMKRACPVEREKQRKVRKRDKERKTEICFKGLAYVDMVAFRSEIHRASGQAGNSGKS